MIRPIVALFAGMLFGGGLALSGMTDPHRVRAFLDLFGDWDPTLAFVMGGAMLPMAVAWRIRTRMARPIADEAFHLLETRRIDAPLAVGAILFGVGWGLGGLCPGPAVASLTLAPIRVAPFLLAMLAGMALHRIGSRARP
ncbi:MAG: YeeE/YedE family protein [Sphingobium sp.]